MLIKSIELKNITSHEQTKINFQKGINLLIGNNGTGKSSILNMIGYVLFDFIPTPQASFVRYSSGKTWGSIEIEIISDDDTEYSIYITIGKQANDIVVKEINSGFILEEITTRGDLNQWVRDIMGIKPEYDLRTIFESAIGVPQGLITAPFLESAPGDRRKYFNKILHVDVYKKVFDNSLKIKNIFRDKKVEMEVIMARNEKEIQLIPEKENTKKIQTKNIEKLEKTLDTHNQELKTVLKSVQKLEDIERKINKSNQEKELLEQKKTNLNKNFDVAREELEESIKAKDVCDSNYDKFKTYNQLTENLPKFEEKNEELAKIRTKIKELEMEAKEINIKISQKEELITNIKNESKKIDELKAKSQTHTSNMEKIDLLKEKITKINFFEYKLNQTNSKLENNLIEAKKIENSIEKLPEIKKMKDKLIEIQNEHIKLDKTINTIESKIIQLKADKKQSKDGNCPILDEKCLNLGKRSLESYFKDQIQVLTEKLKPLELSYDKDTVRLEQLEPIQSQIENLIKENIRFEDLTKYNQDLKIEITEYKKQIKQKPSIQQQMDHLSLQQEKLKEDVNEKNRIERGLKVELPKLWNKVSELETQKIPINKKITKLKVSEEKSSDIPKKLDELKDNLRKFKENHDLFLTNKSSSDKLNERSNLLQLIAQKIKQSEESLLKIKNELVKLEQKFKRDLFNEKKMQKDRLNNLIASGSKELELTKVNLEEINKELQNLQIVKKKFVVFSKKHKKYTNLVEFIETIRNWFRSAGPIITKALLRNINTQATNLYRDLMDIKNVELVWLDDFEIEIHAPISNTKYRNLSGGEQMAAALAVRLAILRIITNVKFAFFDEPTSNLDSEKRMNLSNCIQNIKGFEQLFLISHDDTFEENAEHVIKFEKEEGQNSVVTQLTD